MTSLSQISFKMLKFDFFLGDSANHLVSRLAIRSLALISAFRHSINICFSLRFYIVGLRNGGVRSSLRFSRRPAYQFFDSVGRVPRNRINHLGTGGTYFREIGMQAFPSIIFEWSSRDNSFQAFSASSSAFFLFADFDSNKKYISIIFFKSFRALSKRVSLFQRRRVQLRPRSLLERNKNTITVYCIRYLIYNFRNQYKFFKSKAKQKAQTLTNNQKESCEKLQSRNIHREIISEFFLDQDGYKGSKRV